MGTDLVKEFIYDAHIQTVWQALTRTQKMKEWYFPQLINFDAWVGGKFEFEDGDAAYHKEWIATKWDEGKTFAHSWQYAGYPGSSEVTFSLYD